MPRQDRRIELVAEMFRLLGEPTRLRIMTSLADGELNVSQLCKKLRATQPTISHHLGILRMSGLVSDRRNGKEIYYSVGDVQRSRYPKALDKILKGSPAVRIGPIVLGVTKG